MTARIFSGISNLEKALDTAWQRNKVIADNIANVDTPGYKAKMIPFEQDFDQALSSVKMKKTNPKHMDAQLDTLTARVITRNNTSMRYDGNSVDIDAEMVDMAKNNILYNALIEKVARELRRIKTAVMEGRG
ncbi:MAG TPA: flagellar basal body rod protein FlgB [Clostridia bacterium]|nr:flagellar basal body rod protein FlgB [Clostridia bacterium]